MSFRIATLLVLLFAVPASAEYGRTPTNSLDPNVIKVDEKKFLGTEVDGSYAFVGSDGEEFTLSDKLGKPLILVLSYFKCDGSCAVTNRDLKAVLEDLEGMKAGSDYKVLTASFDPNDDIVKLKMFESEIAVGEELNSGWEMALFKDPADISKLATSIGYKFFWSKRDRAFIHPGVLVLLSPEGRVTRYLYAANIGTREIKVAVAEARFGKTSESKARDISDLLLIACYSYNYKDGRYSLNYPLFIAAGSLIFGVSLTIISMVHFRKKARR